MIHAEEKSFSDIEQKVSHFLEAIGNYNSNKRNIGEHTISKDTTRAFISVPGSVNYVAKSLTTIPYSHVHSPALRVSNNYFQLLIFEVTF